MSLQIYTLSSDGKYWQSSGRPSIPTSPFPYGDYGTYKPSGSTSGYAPTGVGLTTYPASGGPAGPITGGILTLNTPGIHLDSFHFPCRILSNTHDAKVTRSEIVGPASAPTTNTGLIDCHNASNVNFISEDNTFNPQVPSIWWDGMLGHDYTSSRDDVSQVVDGFGIYNTNGPNANVAIYAPYVRDLSFFSPDPNHGGDPSPSSTHNDGIQIQGGLNILIVGANLQGFCSQTTLSRDGSAGADILRAAAGSGSTGPNSLGGYNRRFPNLLGQAQPNLQSNSAIQITSNVSPVGNLIIRDGWADGGFYCFNISATITGTSYIRNMKFGHNSAGDAVTPDTGDDHTHTIVGGGSTFQAACSNNTYEDNGHAIQMR